MRLPKANGAVPIVLAISGLDSRKENLVDSFGAILPHGIGVIAVDGPGTERRPSRSRQSLERVLSRVIDYCRTRSGMRTRDAVVVRG